MEFDVTNNIPSVSVSYASNGSSTKANELGMRVMQERAYEKRGEQYLLIKSPPASGKSRALMFIALDNSSVSRGYSAWAFSDLKEILSISFF
uniref:Uncharacterized protein n=1 Tax=Candidatus Nitrotoga fabula TaxID=2182327 RepID=A0A2X0SJ89_9PROT|nr:protein of unknown function [Candidatus Nitrotoga fabula]